MNILDIVRRVQVDLGRQWDMAGNEYIINQLLDSYRDLVIENNWSFLLKEGKIRLYAYKTLTVSAYTYPTVSVSEAISATEATIYDDQGVYIPEENNNFHVTTVTSGIAGAASFAIDADPVDTPASGDTVYLYVGDYALPADCAFNKEISLIDTGRMRRIPKAAEPTITKATYGQRYLMDDPYIYFAKSKDRIVAATNYNYIGFWPFLNPTAKFLNLWYYRKPFGNFDTFVYTGGTATTAAHTLIEIPDEFSHYLYWKCLELCYYKLNDSRMGYAIQKEHDILHSLKNANNGDAALERILSEFPPTGYPEGEFDMPFSNGIISVRVV